MSIRRHTIAAAFFSLSFCFPICVAQAEEGEVVPTLEENLSNEIAPESPQELPKEDTLAADTLKAVDQDTVSVAINDTSVEPKRVVIVPGATVVWKNNASVPLQVHFIGKAISTTCKAPRGFSIGGKGVYSSSPIAPGGLASLCFLEPELYVYEVRPPIEKGRSHEAIEGVVGAVQVVREK